MNKRRSLPIILGATLLLISTVGIAVGLNRAALTDIRDLADPAMVAVNSDRDDFAGTYVNADHTLLYILFVGSEQDAKDRVASLIPAPGTG